MVTLFSTVTSFTTGYEHPKYVEKEDFKLKPSVTGPNGKG